MRLYNGHDERMSHILLWIGVLGSALMAGIYFVFSAFVMQSLASIPRPQGIAAMQSINTGILSSAFLPLFFGTTMSSLGLAVWGVLRWGQPGSTSMLIGGVVYVVGMFVCTAAFNVPLNESLDAVDPRGPDAARVWFDYVRVWTRWNHVRTVACVISAVLFAVAVARV